MCTLQSVEQCGTHAVSHCGSQDLDGVGPTIGPDGCRLVDNQRWMERSRESDREFILLYLFQISLILWCGNRLDHDERLAPAA